jgi:hypothetical protein
MSGGGPKNSRPRWCRSSFALSRCEYSRMIQAQDLYCAKSKYMLNEGLTAPS